MIVDTGVPLNSYPSKGDQPHLLSIFSFLIVIFLFISTIVKSASKPSLIKPLSCIPKIFTGFSHIEFINCSKVNFPSLT